MIRLSHVLYSAIASTLISGPAVAADFVIPAVPEPGTLALLAAGAGVAALIVRSRRKK